MLNTFRNLTVQMSDMDGTALARIIERVKSKSRRSKAMRLYGPLVDVRNTITRSPVPSERNYDEL
jgi:hypothetical protein